MASPAVCRYLDNCLKGDPSLTPEKAVDGDEDTRWASGRDDNQWYIVDLEERCTITGFGILWEGAHGKEYKIQVSENGTDWTDVIHETNGSARLEELYAQQPGSRPLCADARHQARQRKIRLLNV